MSSLPPEIYSVVLGHVPPLDLQKTTHSLSAALPYYSEYLCHQYLFQHINIATAGQAVRLYLHLRANPHRIVRIQSFSLSSWSVDADVLVSLIRLVPDVQEISLRIGINFAPEHLDELFQRPMMSLKFLGLRFRPYVERATYLQFLKGAYFDTMLKAITAWPSTGIPTISIVQDPPSAKHKDNKQFAQPLVFFRLDSFVDLTTSPYTESVNQFRLRIPSRQVARHIYAQPRSLPNLNLVDLSTSNVSERDIEELMARFTSLRHIIVDECNILRGEWREGDWAIFGKSLALVGAKRSKQREKKIKEWLEVNTLLVDGVETMLVIQPPAPVKKVKKGRQGLAAPTMTLRGPKQVVLPRHVAGSAPPDLAESGLRQKIRMLPSMPTLISFSTTLHPSMGEDQRNDVRREFHTGWALGLNQLSAMRKRMITSWMNGVRIVREDEESDDKGEVGLEGLTDLQSGDEDLIALTGEQLLQVCPCPILCFAGPPGSESHAPECGHQINSGWNKWDTEQEDIR